jgi:thermostable 8-oxoguanine DNA glycosylase
VIDFRNWKVLYGEDKRQFSQANYKKYLTDMREFAEKVDCEVQELDYLLWKEYE